MAVDLNPFIHGDALPVMNGVIIPLTSINYGYITYKP
jgi:hypothetical protein